MVVATDAYRHLQQHLDDMPVGYPATESGVEIELLKAVFTPEQAQIATHLDYKHKTVAQIYQTAEGEIGSPRELEHLLDEMVAKGGITRRERERDGQYALLPLVLWGMFEHQLKMLTPAYLGNLGQYMQNEFGAELAGGVLPRSRYIPIEESVETETRIATYDELHDLIEQAGDQLCVQECICRKVNDLQGKPCQATDRRDVCLSFGDLADLYTKEGWGRRITPEEAFEIARKSQEEGLVLMPGNAQEPTFMCACCDDCCAMLTTYKYLPRPADIIASNYYVQVDTELCNGTGACAEQCPTDAIALQDDLAHIDLGRCIGCGLCVPPCPEDAIRLVQKAEQTVPPQSEEDLYDTIMAGKEARRQTT
ncbi:MAG: 4Fe-4S dicluster domain-containing protein [bacterium]|nr:4Fe-4S dicluster domain-containing protein [bacterium]